MLRCIGENHDSQPDFPALASTEALKNQKVQYLDGWWESLPAHVRWKAKQYESVMTKDSPADPSKPIFVSVEDPA
jgi:hypothetical protein